ncbi:hypothetical protein E2C01_101336 [Portunus trituberculatus]|uniref:Uncharacterized protein n=1 Tax=Portunus trituberculatus TaxID=210409 RepID=A0A5B7KLQ5_PORTR|nr:hypothetical protein [Portunus trituberculatus]
MKQPLCQTVAVSNNTTHRIDKVKYYNELGFILALFLLFRHLQDVIESSTERVNKRCHETFLRYATQHCASPSKYWGRQPGRAASSRPACL